MAASPLSSDGARSDPRAAGPSPSSGWVRRALRAPLFWKLLLPQLGVIGVILGIAAAVLPGATSTRVMVLAFAAGPLVTVGLSAWVLHVALRPVRGLTETARRVAEGDWTARAPSSPLADHRMERLAQVVNEMLDSLAEARGVQRDLSRRVLAAEERERERVAHELYAGTAQTLAGILIRLRVLRRALATGDPEPVLDEVTSEVRLALDEVRTVARRLRPPELDELGVRAALEAHARRLSDEVHIPITLTGDVPEQDLDPGARLALFRIVQEGLTNAILHADATRVTVSFEARPEAFRAEVVDDGTGFDPGSAAPSTDSRLGLVGMRERADYVRGIFTVRSAPGEGTVLRLDLPWALTEPPAEASAPELLRIGGAPP